MRSRVPLISLLLAATLLAGQWLCAVHESDHALHGATPACSVCVAAHQAGTGALPAMPQMALDCAPAPPDATVAAGPLAAILRDHPIRGPPALLA
jgi:hypothetical protein